MYEIAKNIAKTILPEKVFKQQSRNLRSIYGLFLRGNKHECNICKSKLRKFVKLDSNDLLCPICGSLPRTRGLWQFVNKELHHKIVLHFSPSTTLVQVIEKSANTKKYITTDYEGQFEAKQKFNIEKIELEDAAIDVIICYHILEHIKNDKKAMMELFRILKTGGTCYIQTPFKEGSILEDDSINTPEERLKKYGQIDHVRIYSPHGLKSRLEEVGFSTEIIEIENPPGNYYGLKTKDIILKCKKA